MTRASIKSWERIFAEETARLLGCEWSVGPNRESPDFVVDEGKLQFGLEVSEIFTGVTTDGGSENRKHESQVQKIINALRREFEASASIPLVAKFVGNIDSANMELVLPRLLEEDLVSKPSGYHFIIDTRLGLRVHITRSYMPDWYSVNDRVGWIDRNPLARIQEAVDVKAVRLPEYQRSVGNEVRLLLVANRYRNSGKLMLERKPQVDLKGFSKLYFMSYPESVTVFESDFEG